MAFDLESKCFEDFGFSLLLRGKEQAIAGARVGSLNGACVMVRCSRCCRRVGRRCRRRIEGMTALWPRLNVSPK